MPPAGGSGVSRPQRPHIGPSTPNGYQLKPVAIGYEITLRWGWPDGTPSMLSGYAGWALTEAGAHRKAHRIITRKKLRLARDAQAKQYDA
ncbi:hypothetical protein CH252_19030 [Rhodococcus sp. 06-1477-1B]|nr:hypothetical protein CH252_19030 [Rhodococcus sp. 06-1477-1B]